MLRAKELGSTQANGGIARALPERLERRLVTYALAAAGTGVTLLATPQAAQANTIVYKSINEASYQKVSFSLGNATFNFTGEFIPGFFDAWTGYASGGFFFGGYSDFFGNGFLIGPTTSSLHGPHRSLFFGELAGSSSSPNRYFYTIGFFQNHSDQFLGLEFQLHGKTHFGWVDLRPLPVEFLPTPVGERPFLGIDLVSFAYNRVPNAPILTGQTSNHSVPEPSTLTLLALGAAGLPFWRKRRAKETGELESAAQDGQNG